MADENYPVSKINHPADHDDTTHADAMRAAGWTRAFIGDRVLVSYSNGFETWATITRTFKNGQIQVRRDCDGQKHNEHPSSLWVRR